MRAWRHWRRWKRWILKGTAAAALFAAARVAQAPGAGVVVLVSGGTIGVAAPAEEGGDEKPVGEVYARVDGVSASAGAPAPFWAVGVGEETGNGESAKMPGAERVPYRDETQDLPWRRPLVVGLAPSLAPLSAPGLRAEPDGILARRQEEPRELPPLRTTPPVNVTYAFGLGPATRSEQLTGFVKNDPVDATVPNDLPPPGVGSSVPPPGAAVPEPAGAMVTTALATWTLSRRRR